MWGASLRELLFLRVGDFAEVDFVWVPLLGVVSPKEAGVLLFPEAIFVLNHGSSDKFGHTNNCVHCL